MASPVRKRIVSYFNLIHWNINLFKTLLGYISYKYAARVNNLIIL